MFPASTSSRRISSISVVMFPGMKSCTKVVSRAATVSTSDACELCNKSPGQNHMLSAAEPHGMPEELSSAAFVQDPFAIEERGLIGRCVVVWWPEVSCAVSQHTWTTPDVYFAWSAAGHRIG